MGLIWGFLEIIGRPTVGEATLEMALLFLVPISIAFLVGVVIGWAWKPSWANLGGDGKLLNCSSLSSPAALIPSPVKDFCSTQNFNLLAFGKPSVGSCLVEDGLKKEQASSVSYAEEAISSSSQLKKEEGLAVTEEDFKHLRRLVDRTDGGAPWKHVMERSTATMCYQAWQRDQENGPPQYCSRTVYEDATPELLRDFFWDDEFRLEWDDMLLHSARLEECPSTGTMVVHWIRKFPFFCSDREYTIGRRIWESGRSYYCVTKGVPYPSVPRRDKPRRVDNYYSSWFIQAAASRKDGSLTACEVILFHHEDMGIPYEITKFGVRQGMWGAVQKIERGLRLYQKARASGLPQSRSAFLAQINTRISPNQLKITEDSSETEAQDLPQKPQGGALNVPKLLVLGFGAVALACSLDRGLFTKAVVLGVARRFGNVGRRL